jgi:3'-5' exoribonuclease
MQHLVTAVLWDGNRFERFLTGPAALSCYPPLPNANLCHTVETAEHALSLTNGLADVSISVLISAALLHDAGKADDFRLCPDRDGYTYSERGQLVGARYTVLEWLAAARSRDGVIVPEGQYLALVHALTATRGAGWLGIREPQIIEATILAVADRACSETAWSPNFSSERRELVHTGGV